MVQVAGGVHGNTEGAVREFCSRVFSQIGDPVDFIDEFVAFRIDLRQVGAGVGRRGLGGQILQTGQHVADLVHGAFCHLQQGVGLGNVPAGHLETGDVGAELLRNSEPGGVIGGAVDPEARRQSFQRFRHGAVGNAEVFVCIHCRDVVLNSESHFYSSMNFVVGLLGLR